MNRPAQGAMARMSLPVEPLRYALLPAALALATGLDYFDNSIFSFFSSYIAGGINASSDELVWSSSAYAIAAVLGILQQQRFVDRLGYRRYIVLCLSIYSVGAVLSAFAENSLELAVTRALQGYAIGPMMGTCRILIQLGLPAQRRPGAARMFLGAIVLANALAPLFGGTLVTHFGWRMLFACTAPAGLVFAGLCWFVLPNHEQVAQERTESSDLWPYLVFAFSQGALQFVMQQVRFQLFSASLHLILLTLAALIALAWFVFQQWHHPSPMVRLNALRERSFQAGLLLYMLYYYQSTGLSFLISNFLERGLAYPIEAAGRLVGLTGLLSGSALFIYYRYSSKVTHKKWFLVPGFALAAVTAGWISRMPPTVSQSALVWPMLMRGVLVLFIAIPVANVTFRPFVNEEFAHGYRLKNIIRQLTISFTTASVIILEQHRQALHYSRLSESVNAYSPVYQGMWRQLSDGFIAAGAGAGQAGSMAVARISEIVIQQASFMASLDGFRFLVIVSIVAGMFALWQKWID